MLLHHAAGWDLGGPWTLLVVLTFLAARAAFDSSALAVVTLALVLPLMVSMLWQEGSTPTVTEMLHTVEQQS
jgi:hypothetical protein